MEEPVPDPAAAPGADEVLGVLVEAAEAVVEALGGVDDWGETGVRAGEHHSDLAADRAAVAVLAARGYGVLSEESGVRPGARPVTVVVDPLDGSTNASRRMGWWACSLCALDGDGPLAALVVDLRHGTRWWATRGGGAWRDGGRVEPSGCTEVGDAIVGLNGAPARHGGWAQYRAFGACALDLCAVADGTLDGYLDCTTDELGPWDYLGGLLVCREAGATVVDAFGRDLVVLDHGARRVPVAGASEVLARQLVAEHPDLPRR